MAEPLVSVLIPTFNYARYLPEAIESVLAQDLAELELIIADDASTDETAAVCAAYVARDPRIRFHRHPRNLGMVENWNWCLAQARAPYVKFLLADDKLLGPTALRQLSDLLARHPRVRLATSARVIIDDRSTVIDLWDPLGKTDAVVNGLRWSRRQLEGDAKVLNQVGEPTAVMFRRADAARGFDPALRQLVDLEMWMHLLAIGDLAYLAAPLCCFRRHPLQQTEANRALNLHKMEEVELCQRYCAPRARAFALYRRLRRMEKPDLQPALQAVTVRIRSGFTPGQLAWLGLRYRLWRLGVNLRHSWNKRMRAGGAS